MHAYKLPESELKVMDFIWERGAASARETADYMAVRYGWKKNTTYTVLTNLIEKNFLARSEPGFLCKPLVAREMMGKAEAKNLLERFYQGSAAALFSSFLDDRNISEEELVQIKKMIEESR
ncbi:MAG TPA: BlaI/MecI/CopY family transcriptional regulator [Candidatus Acidoferrum sp.]|nr:BlaI/MecI/CopY family transcriptional regulator [Candidatus Acidoferrum sp.]